MATPGYAVEHRHSVSSTQDEARGSFRERPVLVTASRQSAGRGRAGRAWENAPRALAASLAVRPRWPSRRWTVIPLTAGLAARGALDPFPAGLKWPNDLTGPDGTKVGGLLVETDGRLVVIGLGVNLWWPQPPAGYGAVHEADPGPEAGPALAEGWADRLLAALAAHPDDWGRDEYRRSCVTLGRRVAWEPAGSGTARDVDPDGGLVVETEAGPRTITAGEVRTLRTATLTARDDEASP